MLKKKCFENLKTKSCYLEDIKIVLELKKKILKILHIPRHMVLTTLFPCESTNSNILHV